MVRFTKKFFLLITIILVCMSGIIFFDYFVIGSQYKNNYQASLLDKVERLESINEPKIILVGNSNLAFGISSVKIENELDMPVVNLGLHGGLGNAFHEQIAKLNINEGDIVIVCHSSFSDTDEITDPELAWVTYDYNNQLLSIFRKKDYITMLTAYPSYLRDSYFLWLRHKGNLDSGVCYSRSAFNEYGDVVYKPIEDQMDTEKFFSEQKISVPEINDICVNRLNELNNYCKERSASLVVAGYPIAYGRYADFTKTDFEKFEDELADALDCDVISDYTDYFYPYEYFYDTTLHLNEEGAEVRTQQLIDDLENWIDEGSYEILSE